MKLLVTFGPVLAVAALIVGVLIGRLIQLRSRGVGAGSVVGPGQSVYVQCRGCRRKVLVASHDNPSAEAPRGSGTHERVCPHCQTVISIANLPPMPD
jgi:hypothetical protein